MSDCLVSVLIACHNQRQWVLHALNSMLDQTHRNIELLITDDCSTDDSVAVIERWIADHDVPCAFTRNAANLGICKVLNGLVRSAKGKYICICAADDFFMPDRIERQVRLLESLPEEVGIVYGDAHVVDADGNIIQRSFYEHYLPGRTPPSGDIFWLFLDRMVVLPLCAMMRASVFDVVGYYDERLVYEDRDMGMRMARHYRFHYHPDIVACYRRHPGQHSQQHRRSDDNAARYTLILASDFRSFSKHLDHPKYGDRLIARMRTTLVRMVRLKHLKTRELVSYALAMLRAEMSRVRHKARRFATRAISR